MHFKRIFLVLLTIMISGCTSSTTVLMTEKMPHRPTKVHEIMVYLGAPPIKARPLAVIAIARRGENSVWAVEALKTEAAEMGADAIANLDITYSTGIIPELRVSGLAVKYAISK